MLVKRLTLASATLSGGMRIAAAAGGLPQRLTVQDDLLLNKVGALGNGLGGVCLDPDGLHVWVSTYTVSNSVKKIRLSDGAVIATFTNNSSDGGARTITGPSGLYRRGTKIYFANVNTPYHLGEIDTQTMVCRLYSNAVVTGPVHFASVESGKAWVRATPSGNATYSEVTLSGTGDAAAVAATGRTVAGSYGVCSDGGGGEYGASATYAVFATSSTVTRFKLSDGTTTTFAGTSNFQQSAISTGVARGIYFDPILQRVVVANVNGSNEWIVLNAAFSGTEGRVWGPAEMGGPILVQGSNYLPSLVSFSDDLSRCAFASWNIDTAPSETTSVRSINLATQRARWSWTPGRAAVVDSIVMPGLHGNARGAIEQVPPSPSFLSGVYDHRKTRFWYSFDGGANRTEFSHADQLSLAVGAAQTLTIDVDMRVGPDKPLGPRPWIADAGGTNGPVLLYSIAEPTRRLRGAA